jgi:hypothetical protein
VDSIEWGGDRDWGEEKEDTVKVRALVAMVFTWNPMLGLRGFNLELMVVVGCFLVSFLLVRYSWHI